MADSGSERVQQALLLIREGQKPQARQLLREVLVQNRDDFTAWATLASIAETPKEAEFCVRQVLRVRPEDPWALRRLNQLQNAAGGAVPSPTRAPTPSAPLSSPSPSPSPVANRPGGASVPPAPVRIEPPGLPPSSSPETASPGSTPVPPRGLTPQEIASRRREAAERERDAVRRMTMIAVGVVMLLVAIGGAVFYFNFYYTRPGDDKRALAAAQAWTVAEYAWDYDAQLKLMCADMKPSSMDPGAALVGQMMGGLGGQLKQDPPRTLRYQVTKIQGYQAWVEVTGFAPGHDELFNRQVYLMRREGGEWKWCGVDWGIKNPLIPGQN